MRSKTVPFVLGISLLVLMIMSALLNPSLRKKFLSSSGSKSGDMLDYFVYNSPSGEEKNIYSRFSTLNYTFETGDYVEYDVRLLEKVTGTGGIEILTSDDSAFREIQEWKDQKGVSGHPAADLSEHAFKKWYHRALPVPPAMVGKTSVQWALAGENDDDSRNYEAQYANIVVTDGNKTIKRAIFQAAGDFHWDDLSVISALNTGSASLSPVSINAAPTGNPRVIEPGFPSDDVVIASFVVTESPYLADAGGIKDATGAIQQALTDCYNAGGGVVWLPAGKYRITGNLHVPPHVTLRGDWRDPDQGKGSYGAVILADVPAGDDTGLGLINIWGSAGVKGLTIYYPNQSMDAPISYPFTLEILGRYLGEDGHMSSSIQNVTLLNSYRGISAGKDATHEIHTIRNVKGTVLSLGLYLQDTADVGKVERIKLNNSYWADLDPSLGETHPSRTEIDAFTRQSGTGLLMGGVEWDQITELSLSDYSLGIGFVQGRRIESTLMMFDVSVENSQVAMRISNLDSRIGVVVSNGLFHANQGPDPIAIDVTNSNGASVIFNNSTIGGGANTAVKISGSTAVSFVNCIFDEWVGPYGLSATSGTLAVEGSQFLPTLSSNKKGVQLQTGVYSATLLGNTYSPGEADFLLENTSTAEVKRQDGGYTLTSHDVASYPWRPTLPRPANDTFLNIRLAPYGARADGKTDATAAIQAALDAAGRKGGGTVYLPAGIYRISTHLTVPAGVELRGSDEVTHRAMLMGRGTGTILLAFEGRGTTDPQGADPFIFLNGDGAGVRGLSIHYPEQATDAAANIVAYPWTIRGSGESVYVYDVALSNAWRAVDFATYPTDHHYINQVVGLALNEGIRVGNSVEGWVEDCLFNINAWARVRGLPGMLDEGQTLFRVAGKYTRANLKAFVVTAGAKNEHLLSNFVYGAHTGFTFESSANATAINIAADGGVDTFEFTGTGPEGVKVINSEGCGCGLEGVGLKVSGGMAQVWNFITMEPYDKAIHVTGGEVLLQGAAFHHNFALINGGKTTLNAVLFRDAGDHVTIQSGEVNLWGNMGGRTVFKIVGAAASEGCNIRR